MTRKDYKLIAAVFAKFAPNDDDPGLDMWDDLLSEMTRALADENPRFDSFKFREAAEDGLFGM